ncbi:MAG: nuclear transport factor 2 family protein [Rhodospirillales bacterium]|nr:nuclear transport factor 2 family protein [Rhodospirillales bacterium]
MPTVEQRLDKLEREVAVFKAQDGIRKTLSQYAIGVDDKRPEILSAIFADNAVLKVPAWDVDLAGKDAVLGFFTEYWSRFDTPRRYYANEDFSVDNDTATAFMYWHVTQERDGESYLGWGTYDWGFRHVGERWIITNEVVHIRAMTTLARGWAGPDKLERL